MNTIQVENILPGNQKAPICIRAFWRGGQEDRTPFGENRIDKFSGRGRIHATIPSDTAPHDDYTAHQNNNNPDMIGTAIDSIHRNGVAPENFYKYITGENSVKSVIHNKRARVYAQSNFDLLLNTTY